MRRRGSTHQDVSLQEQPRLNGDADAGLAVSLDVAVGAGGQRERAAEGGGGTLSPCCPTTSGLLGDLTDFDPRPSPRRGSRKPHPAPLPLALERRHPSLSLPWSTY